MQKTTFYCDNCGKESKVLQRLTISSNHWKIDTEICGECYKELDDAKHENGSCLFDIRRFFGKTFNTLKMIIKSK